MIAPHPARGPIKAGLKTLRPYMKRLLIAALAAGVAGGGLLLFPEAREALSLEYLKHAKDELQRSVAARPLYSAVAFFLAYVFVAALSIPGAAIMTLAAGALFGLLWGTILVSMASTVGATLAFLIVRALFGDAIRRRFANAWAKISEGFERDGPFYLFSLRLVFVVPFFLVNILMALTTIRVRVFFFVSQLGMLPATLVYVNAGTELSKIDELGDVLSPSLIAAFLLIAALPWIGRLIVNALGKKNASS